RAEDAASRLRVLALAWFVVPVAFFSLSGSKLPGYVLPALPGAALLAADRVHRYVRGEGGLTAMRVTGVLALLLFAAGLAYAFQGSLPWGGGAGAPGLSTACALFVVAPAGASGALALLWPGRRALCATAVATGSLLTVVLIAGCALGPAAKRESVRGLLITAAEQGHGSLPVFQLHAVERSAEFYAAGRLAYDAAGEPLKFEGANQVEEAVRRSGGSGLVLVPTEHEGQLTGWEPFDARVLGSNGSYSLVLVKVR
ncbi:MAG TPA: hypothetical protein VD968_04665, partial [Pyrinomonadaceae bacterium]|nr:hypothetical protein [Pyrinomonadaceae bacterium]